MYAATVTVRDGLNESTQDITVSVINLNDNAPTFNNDSISRYAVDANTIDIGSISATDADGIGLTYSITGSDITIQSDGTLAFHPYQTHQQKIF